MKTKYVIIALCLFCTTLASAQDNKLFDKYADMDNVTSVYISKAMFQMIPMVGDIGLSLTNLAGKLESLQIVTTEQKNLIPQMRNEFSTLVKSSHEELMRVRDGGTRVNFYSNMKGDKISELLMLADADSTYAVILINGNFTLKDIQDIAKEMEK